jgi:hypothetical protein
MNVMRLNVKYRHCLVFTSADITWTRGGSPTSLTCSGEHELTCSYTFTPEYDSDGEYKCKGYNIARGGQKAKESVVTLTTGMS